MEKRLVQVKLKKEFDELYSTLLFIGYLDFLSQLNSFEELDKILNFIKEKDHIKYNFLDLDFWYDFREKIFPEAIEYIRKRNDIILKGKDSQEEIVPAEQIEFPKTIITFRYFQNPDIFDVSINGEQPKSLTKLTGFYYIMILSKYYRYPKGISPINLFNMVQRFLTSGELYYKELPTSKNNEDGCIKSIIGVIKYALYLEKKKGWQKIPQVLLQYSEQIYNCFKNNFSTYDPEDVEIIVESNVFLPELPIKK
jgi:hypothetical protein